MNNDQGSNGPEPASSKESMHNAGSVEAPPAAQGRDSVDQRTGQKQEPTIVAIGASAAA